ncbi:MAG: type IV secretory system conjugative DNA transfer family protein, partial [Longimicrobiales bacterium]
MKAPSVRELPTTTSRRVLDGTGAWIVLLVAAAFIGTWAGTQYLAHRLAYHENLGPILYRVPSSLTPYVLGAAWTCIAGALVLLAKSRSRRYAIPLALAGFALYTVHLGPIYSPFQLLRWARAYHGIPELAAPLSGAYRVAGGTALVSLLGGLLLLGSRSRRTVSRSHGSAHWGQGANLQSDDGLMIGRRIEDGALLRFNDEGHLITLAPTRSGKGVSAVIPNLLDYPGSVLVVDVKPENAAVAARRRRELDQEVRILDPFEVAGGWDGFNPLDLIDVSSPDAIDDARMIADMMFAIDEGAENVHWNETARAFLAGLALYVKVHAAAEDQHLLHLRKLATLRRGTPRSPGAFEDLLNRMLDSRAVGGLISRAAAVLLQKPFKERGSVISALHRHTEFLDSPHLQRALCRSTFDLADLKRRHTSVFLCLPSDRIPEYHR